MCKSCKSKVSPVDLNLPLFEARSLPTPRVSSKVVITSRSKVELDLPQGKTPLYPGGVLVVEDEIAQNLIQEGAPIWVLSKR